jgi:tellurite resistance protein TerC
MHLESVGTPVMWIGFTAFVLAMLALDLGVFHRKAHVVKMREALTWSAVWVGLALAFNVGVYFWFGSERALEFLTAYLIEETLSVDNLFVFLVIFGYFAVPPALQHRVLFWGIVGAITLRIVFILAGAALLQRFHWVMYLFGAFLVFTGIRLLVQREAEMHPERNPVLRIARRVIPTISEYRGTRFTVVENGRRYATPLLMVLLVIEATDVVFAVDSIPAVFAVTEDPFIVFTSNIFAVLGLRSLYFALAGMMEKFHYLKVGLGLVLAFVGVKMLIADVYKLPIIVSLVVIASLLGGAIAASILRPPARPPAPLPDRDEDEQPEAAPTVAGSSSRTPDDGSASARLAAHKR